MRTDGRALVSMQGIVKRFGAVEALRGVDLELGRGEVLGLVGDNAAGISMPRARESVRVLELNATALEEDPPGVGLVDAGQRLRGRRHGGRS